MRVDNKMFYFDIGQNRRGTFMRVSEVSLSGFMVRDSAFCFDRYHSFKIWLFVSNHVDVLYVTTQASRVGSPVSALAVFERNTCHSIL